jgi:hypothetical protein
MVALIQFVDSIAASPTVRLDVNDAVSWFCTSFKAPPPRLRRSVSANAMRDGDHVSSASYENRTLELELTLVNATTEDAAATEMQKLWRQLDRADNFLRYQPEGMTKPVFFRLFRSDANDLEELWTVPIARKITIDLLAEPFALGLPETLGPYTVNNDPAAASNPCYFDVTGVIGDVPALPLLRNTTAKRGQTIMAIRQHGTPASAPVAVQCESMSLGTATTNPGGGPDAVMSGTGTNNYVRTSFAASTDFAMRAAYSWTANADTLGKYVIYAAVRRSDNTSVITVGAGRTDLATPTATALPLTTSRILVRLGMVDLSSPAANPQGGTTIAVPSVQLWAGRASGAGTLDWDCMFLIPADRAMLHARGDAGGVLTDFENWFDSGTETAIVVADGASPTGLAVQTQAPMQTSGSFLSLAPNQTNRIWWLTQDASSVPGHAKTITDSVSVSYRPRYLHVRPSAS